MNKLFIAGAALVGVGVMVLTATVPTADGFTTATAPNQSMVVNGSVTDASSTARDNYTVSYTPAESSKTIIEDTLLGMGATGYRLHFGATPKLGGHWAGTDVNTGDIYVNSAVVPLDKAASVAVHEYQHVLQGRLYGGLSGTVAHYGSRAGMEKGADCMGYAVGMTWGNYVPASACK